MTTLFAASMGPPSFGGGNSTGTVLYLRMKLRLQWGHRLSAVETRLVPWSHRRTLTRFNGATVFRRWKRPQRPICELKGGSFNGATVFRRWKPGGFVNSSSGNLSLQWGHRLSAVETVTMQETLHGPIDWLQWGHRLSAVETLRYFFSSIECNAASMGPPSFGGGNFPVLHHRRSSSSLQWGHRLSAVETGLSLSFIRLEVSRFNGATVFRRWKPARRVCRSV